MSPDSKCRSLPHLVLSFRCQTSKHLLELSTAVRLSDFAIPTIRLLVVKLELSQRQKSDAMSQREFFSKIWILQLQSTSHRICRLARWLVLDTKGKAWSQCWLLTLSKLLSNQTSVDRHPCGNLHRSQGRVAVCCTTLAQESLPTRTPKHGKERRKAVPMFRELQSLAIFGYTTPNKPLTSKRCTSTWLHLYSQWWVGKCPWSALSRSIL